MSLIAKIDEYGTPAWIGILILSFLFWPLGLAVLAFLLWSGRLGCWKRSSMSGWRNAQPNMRAAGTWWHPSSPSSGNRAFDEYRNDTLRRLEEEQREFHDFLDRLRMAKDKSEFDQFMAERRNRPAPDPRPQG